MLGNRGGKLDNCVLFLMFISLADLFIGEFFFMAVGGGEAEPKSKTLKRLYW